ncbi:MAG: hypothetical protein COB49_02130 [Alphaproteobacteria bacterium]|nr:MAG: hypothetical protein COB49_02130 [Alphaproteobacteria bacterium]
MSAARDIESPRALALALWRQIEAEQPDPANQLTVLCQMWAAYQDGQSASRSAAQRRLVMHGRARGNNPALTVLVDQYPEATALILHQFEKGQGA